MKLSETQKYYYAKAKVEKLKGFYTHLAIYLIVNIIFVTFKVIRNMNNGESFKEAFFDASTGLMWMIWGIFLIVHAFSVFGLDRILGKNWEEERIKRYMDENKNL